MSPQRNIHRLAGLLVACFAVFAATAAAEPHPNAGPGQKAGAADALVSPATTDGEDGDEVEVDPPPVPCDPDDGCFYDTDADGVEDSVDNCRVTYNPDQADNDGDGIGNVCDDTPNGSGGGGGGGGGGSTATAALSADPTTITRGQSTRLTWSSTNASSCDGDWSGTLPFQGSQQLTPSVTTTYRIVCNGASASATVTVNDAPPPPPVVYACSDGIDNDNPADGLVDMADPGCSAPNDNDEYNDIPEPDPAYYEGSQWSDDRLVFASAPRIGCATVGDSVRYERPGRVHWTYTLRVLEFCWDSVRITRVNGVEVVKDINPLPWAISLFQSWRYNQVALVSGASGGSLTVVRADGLFEFCTLKYGCLNTQQPWIRLELSSKGQAVCTTSARPKKHGCFRG